MKKTDSKRNDTKQLIFTAALELFSQKGYSDVSIRDIAEKVNIKGASIYYHYESKEDILYDILNYYDEHTDFYIQELAQTDLDAIPVEEYPVKMHFNYRPEEALHMFYAGQVVLNEQFRNRRAAASLLGSKFDDYVDSYEAFFKSVAQKMGINGENSRKYAEILARISITFMMQFQHKDMFDAVELSRHMDDIYGFMFAQFLKEKRIDDRVPGPVPAAMDLEKGQERKEANESG